MTMKLINLVAAACAASFAAIADVEPETLDFGPFELANPAREARVKLGLDEPAEVKKAVADMLSEVEIGRAHV